MLVFVGAFFYSLYCMHVGNYDTSTWLLPYRLSVPFDTKQIWGWYLLWFFQTNIGFTYSTTQIGISSHFMSCCFYISAICDNFDYLINSMEIEIQDNVKKSISNIHHENNGKLARRLSNAVEIHIKALE